MCSICQREGHLKSSCPEENLPPLSPLPPLGRQYGDALDYLIQKVPSRCLGFNSLVLMVVGCNVLLALRMVDT